MTRRCRDCKGTFVKKRQIYCKYCIKDNKKFTRNWSRLKRLGKVQ